MIPVYLVWKSDGKYKKSPINLPVMTGGAYNERWEEIPMLPRTGEYLYFDDTSKRKGILKITRIIYKNKSAWNKRGLNSELEEILLFARMAGKKERSEIKDICSVIQLNAEAGIE